MNSENKVIVLDAGNTAIKFAVFENGEIAEIHRFHFDEFVAFLTENSTYLNFPCIISSVLTEQKTVSIQQPFKIVHVFNENSILPITIDYLTPKTLGKDRICNAVAINSLNQNKNSVSIDIGTCIKFDFVSKEGHYLGGSISPGIHLRYKSLNDFTDNLPLLSNLNPTDLIGRNTNESIHSGVINGIQSEINDLMQRYSKEYEDLTFFMTGGDAHHFDFHRKSNIFVDENLTLKGLFTIYLLNAR